MDSTYAAFLWSQTMLVNYEAVQLNRIEVLLTQLISILTVPSMQLTSQTAHVFPEELDADAPSLVVPGFGSQASESLHVLKSRQRRKRAAKTKQRMWVRLQAISAQCG